MLESEESEPISPSVGESELDVDMPMDVSLSNSDLRNKVIRSIRSEIFEDVSSGSQRDLMDIQWTPLLLSQEVCP